MATRQPTLTPPHLHDSSRWRGLRIGLLGGSFNPPHEGHWHIAKLALAKLRLDFIWWVVTPQNPLKQAGEIRPYPQRIREVEALTAGNPRFTVTHLEDMLGTRNSFETVCAIQSRFPATEFVWICGLDNALIFHQWDRWRDLAQRLPLVFIARPPAGGLIRNCKLRMLGPKDLHCHIGQSHKNSLKTPGIYWILDQKMIDVSSTDIRLKSGN